MEIVETCDTCFFKTEVIFHSHFRSRPKGEFPWTKKTFCYVNKKPEVFPVSNTCDKWEKKE
jgi:hypothetical protein